MQEKIILYFQRTVHTGMWKSRNNPVVALSYNGKTVSSWSIDVWHVIMRPSFAVRGGRDSIFTDVPFHFKLSFPDNYPLTAPKVRRNALSRMIVKTRALLYQKFLHRAWLYFLPLRNEHALCYLVKMCLLFICEFLVYLGTGLLVHAATTSQHRQWARRVSLFIRVFMLMMLYNA